VDDDAARLPGVVIHHAGTKRDGKDIVTAGGRVLNVTALGETLEDARRRAYEAADLIRFEGKVMRRDIGVPNPPAVRGSKARA
jgi:phosphoribosylamine---glycine ligase